MKKVYGALLALLAFVLIAAMTTGTAVAGSSGTSGTSVNSGKCGDNLTWTLDNEGVLTISGTGSMNSYSSTYVDGHYVTSAPWGAGVSQVTINKGVTSIGNYAFLGCTSLTSITIPDSVTSIGFGAFDNCTGLTSVTIPDSVTSIGSGAFYWCTGLTSVTIPDSVTSIGSNAFSFCPGLTSVTIPDSVTSIGSSAFCYCTGLTSVTIPDSVTSIGTGAFYGCTGLTSVTFYARTTTFGSNVFNNHAPTIHCYKDSDAEDWAIQNNYTIEYLAKPNSGLIGNLTWDLNDDGLLTIEGEGAMPDFRSVNDLPWDCEKVREIIIADSVTSIGGYAFQGCTSLTSVTIPDSVTIIGDTAFSGCTRLTSVTIPDGVTSIGSNAFYNCTRLTSVTIPDSVTSIGDWAFGDCTGLTSVTIPDGVTSIGSNAFYNCTRLTSVTIPDSVTSIGGGAFEGCTGLTSVTIPDSVTNIGDGAFSGCRNLGRVVIPNSVPTFGTDVFFTIPTIYCYEESDADFWAYEMGYPTVYLDDIDAIRTISFRFSFRLPCGESRTLVADVFPNHDNPTITWSSSNPDAVSVDENGVLTALAPGVVVITATVGGASASVTVMAYIGLEAFELSESEIWMINRTETRLTVASVTPEGAEPNIVWTSSDTSVATVDENGLVKSGLPGNATITATDDATGITNTCLIHSCYSVSAIAFAEDAVRLLVGVPYRLTANVTMNTQTCVNRLVTFASSDESVATVDQYGLVTPVGAGAATITATSAKGITAECTVLVEAADETVTMRLPASATRIEEEAFAGTGAVVYVLPAGITYIGPRAFAGLQRPALVIIPTSDEIDIDGTAFAGSAVTIECPAGSPVEAWAVANGIPTVNP